MPFVLFLMALVALSCFGASPADLDLDRRFTKTVKPFVATYCAGCHSGQNPAAQLNLDTYSKLSDVVRDHPR